MKKNPSYQTLFQGWIGTGRFYQSAGSLRVTMWGDLAYGNEIVAIRDRKTFTITLSRACPKWRELYSMISQRKIDGDVWTVELAETF